MVRARTICLLLFFVTVLAYTPVRHAALVVFDDPVYVGNPHVQAGLTWAGVKWAFTTWYGSNWHPLTWLSHMLDATIFGADMGPQHFVNVLIHAANAVLLFLLLHRLTKKMWPAAFVAAVFAWHPLHVESVAWISERKDVLSTFFGFLTLLAYATYTQHSATRHPRTKAWYAGTLALFALSLLAKPMLVTLPCVMLLLDEWPLARIQFLSFATIRSDRRKSKTDPRHPGLIFLIVEKLPFLALSLGSSVVTFFAQRTEAVASLAQCPLDLRLENALVSYAAYLGKAIWPVNLAVIYPFPAQIPAWQITVAAALLAFLSLLAWRMRKLAPYFLVGWLWYLGALVPVIGLIQVGGQALADRYTYFPLIGVSIALAYGLQDLATHFKISQRLVAGAATVALLACLGVTEHQLPFWQNSRTLFTRAVAVTTNNSIAHVNLGIALEEENQIDLALAEYRKAIAITPNGFQGHNNLANMLAIKGQSDEAIREYREAIRLNPDDAIDHVNFATLFAQMGRFADAGREYAEAARLDPTDSRPHYLMGKASLRAGKSREAVEHFRAAIQLAPKDFKSLTWLARVLAADGDASLRNAAEAISLAERANQVTGGVQPFVLDTLAMAYAEAGRFPDARDAVQKAIQITSTSGSLTTLPDLEQRRDLYSANQPYREDFSQTPAPAESILHNPR